MNTKLKGLGLKPQTGAVEQLGIVSELFADCKDVTFHDKNRVNFQFNYPEDDERILVVLSNGLANAYATGKLTQKQCLNLPVYKITTNQDGEPLTDKNGNVIPHMLVMGSTQAKGFDLSAMDTAKVKEHTYQPSASGAFDDLM